MGGVCSFVLGPGGGSLDCGDGYYREAIEESLSNPAGFTVYSFARSLMMFDAARS